MAASGSNSSSDDNNSNTIFGSAIPGRGNNSAAAAAAAAAATAAAAAGTRSFPTLVDDDSVVGDLRSSCDRCWLKKRKCTGEKPCSRCKRGGVQCRYSTKRKLGRPRMSIMTGAAAAAESGKEGTEGSDEASPSTTKRTKQHATPRTSRTTTGTTTGGGVVLEANSNNSSSRSGSRSGSSSSSSSSCSSSNNNNSNSGRRSSSGDSNGGGKRCSTPSSGSLMMSTDRPAFSVSPATGLAGLAESRFLSCFLEHFAPMYEIADEACIRGGLVHAFVGRWAGGAMSAMQGPEVMRGNAFECILLSSMAIGGLMMGCPQSMVARHIDGARQCLVKFRGLSEQCAMTAMMLYGLSHAFQSPVDSNVEYRANMDGAQAMFNTFADKDPLVAAFLTYRATCDNLIDFEESAYSVNPANISGRGRDADRPAGLRLKTAKGTAVAERAEKGPAGLATARRTPPPPAHPAYVVADALVLVYRFVLASGDTETGWWHMHDFIAAEMTRLEPLKPGALVMITLAGSLLAAKAEVMTTDGMLAVAELVLAMFQTCPGLLRYYALHNAHLSLAVFRLLGCRKAYDDLRDLAAGADVRVPTFDEMIPGVLFCDSELCWKCVHSMLKQEVRDDDQGPVPFPGFSARRTLSSRVPFLDLGLAPRSHPSSQSDECESPTENCAPASDGGGSGGSQAQRAFEEKARASPCGEETAALLESEAPSDAFGGGSPWAVAAVVVGGARGGVATSQGAWQKPLSGGARGRGAIDQSGGVAGTFMLPKGEIEERRLPVMPEQGGVERQVLPKQEEQGYHIEREGRRQERGYGEDVAFAFPGVDPRWANEDLTQAERAPDSMYCVGLSSRVEAEARQYGTELIETGRAESREMHTQEWFERAFPFDAGGGIGSSPSRAQSYRMPQGGWDGDGLEGRAGGGGGGGGGGGWQGWGGARGGVPSPDDPCALDSGGVPSFQAATTAGRGKNFGSTLAVVKTADDSSLVGTLTAAANKDVGIAPTLPSCGPRSGDAGYGSSSRSSGGSRSGVSYSGARAFGVAGAVYGANPVGGQVVLPGAPHVWINEQVDERTGKGRHTGFNDLGVCSDLEIILLEQDGGGGAMS